MEAQSVQPAEMVLADRLFVPAVRWGWEYVHAVPERSPEVGHEPVWREPGISTNFDLLDLKLEYAKSSVWPRLKLTGSAFFFAVILSIFGASLPVLGGLVIALGLSWAILPVVFAHQDISRAQREETERHDEAAFRYQQAVTAWRYRIEEHDQREARRCAAALLWYPLGFATTPSRVDVFGGIDEGWASLLATAGASMLQSGQDLLVIDLTEHDVADGLSLLARHKGVPVRRTELPKELARVGLLDGLDSEELTDLLVDSVRTLRKSADSPDLEALDAELLGAVVRCLDAPVTFARLAAGLRVLRRTYEQGPLTDEEVVRLTSYVDSVGHGDYVVRELQLLTNSLEQVAEEEAAGAVAPEPWWFGGGLAVVATAGKGRRQKDFVDRVVFHRVLRELRSLAGHGREVLVVAGADHIGSEGLETMARYARRAGVRLVFLVKHLRDETEHLLGSSDSATILMRMGNNREAAVAADFIGRDHKFVLSQVTQNVGETRTVGTGSTTGGGTGVATTTGTSVSTGSGSMGLRPTSSRQKTSTSSRTFSVSTMWQETVNVSQAETTGESTAESRVYEYTVEPTAIQNLPLTAFVLVEAAPTGRRIVFGDCNPGVSLLPRVATEPRRG